MMKAVMLAALGAVATGAFGEVVETNRINVTKRPEWAQATTVEKLPTAKN